MFNLKAINDDKNYVMHIKKKNKHFFSLKVNKTKKKNNYLTYTTHTPKKNITI